MTTFFDTSAVIPLTNPDHEGHEWCKAQYERALADNPPIVIADIVYCEVSMGFESVKATDTALGSLLLERYPMTDEMLFRAGKAFKQYKRSDGKAGNVLPDFLIGAMAEVDGAPLVTRDEAKIKTYFPGVGRIAPKK